MIENKDGLLSCKKIASMYSLFVGMSMIGMWIMFYFTGGIPELQTKPVELGMHIAAELITAVLLIVGAIGLLINKKWGYSVYLISMGMLIYTLIMSPGYFLQKGDMAFVVMFMVLLILAIIFTVLLYTKKNH